MATRNVTKQLICAEDIAHGVGTLNQVRGGQSMPLRKVDIPYAINDISELAALDPVEYPRVRLGAFDYIAQGSGYKKSYNMTSLQYAVGVVLTVNYPYAYSNGVVAEWVGALPHTISGLDTPDFSDTANWKIFQTSADAALRATTPRAAPSLKSLSFAAGFLQQYSIAGFYFDSTVGGGTFVWDPDLPKTAHNGVTVVAPEAVASWNGSQTDLATLFNWTGGGTGCYVRLNSVKIGPACAGAIADNRTIDNTVAFKAFHKAVKASVYEPGVEYTVKQTNQINYFDGDTIDFNGATIYVHPSTTISDAAGFFGRFANWVYFRAETTPVVKGISIICPKFIVERLGVNAFGGADTRPVRQSHLGSVLLDRPVFRGIGEPSGLGGPGVGNDAKQGSMWYGNGYVLDVAKPDLEYLGQGIIALGSRRIYVAGGSITSAGVSKDFTTWANAAAVLCRGSEYIAVDGVRIDKTGGSAIFCSQDDEYLVKSVNVTNNNIKGAGLSAITTGHRTYAGTPSSIENVTITGNTIKGFCCAIDADLHTAVKVSLESSDSSGFIRSVELRNNVDFLAPWELFNDVTGEVSGSYNINKTIGHDVGSQYSSQVSANAAGTIEQVVVADALFNHSRLGLLVTNCNYVTLDVQVHNHGWSKKVDLTPWQIQQSVRVTSNKIVRGAIAVTQQSVGVSRSDGFCSPVFLADNLDLELSIKTAKLNNQKYPVRLSQSVENCKTRINALSSDTSINDSGHLYLVDLSSGSFTQSSLLKVVSDSVNIVTGGRSISPSASAVKKASSDTAGTRAQTLYSAKLYFEKQLELFGGLTGVMTVAPAAGELIDGSSTPIAVAAGEKVVIYSDGTTWHTL